MDTKKGVRLTLRISKALDKKLEERMAKSKRSKNAEIALLLEQFIEVEEKLVVPQEMIEKRELRAATDTDAASASDVPAEGDQLPGCKKSPDHKR